MSQQQQEVTAAPVIDAVAVAKGASQHEIRVQPAQNEMKMARANSTTAHALAEGVQNYKGEKVTAAQKEHMEEALPHISKMANTHAIKTAGRINDMEKAEANADIAHALVEGVQNYKGEKVTAAQKEHMEEALPHISKMANTHAIKTAGRINDMEKAEANADIAHALVEGVQNYKGEKVEAKTKENKTELNKAFSNKAE